MASHDSHPGLPPEPHNPGEPRSYSPLGITEGTEAWAYQDPSRVHEFLKNHRRLAAASAAVLAAAGLAIGTLQMGGHEQAADGTEQMADRPDTTPTTDRSEHEQELVRRVLVYPRFSLAEVEAKSHDLNQDPTFRASTVSIYGFSSKHLVGRAGMGGLIRQEDGSLGIQTIEHVASDTEDYDIDERYAHIPGVGTLALPAEAPPLNRDDAKDAIVTFSLTSDQQALLELKIDKRVIEPLTPKESESPQPGDEFVIASPETGEEVKMVFVRVLDSDDAGLAGLFSGTSPAGEYMFVAQEYIDAGFFADGTVTREDVDVLRERLQGVDLAAVNKDFCEGHSGSVVRKAGTNDAFGNISMGVDAAMVDGKYCSLLTAVQFDQPAVDAEPAPTEAGTESTTITATTPAAHERPEAGTVNEDTAHKGKRPWQYIGGALTAVAAAATGFGARGWRRRNRRPEPPQTEPLTSDTPSRPRDDDFRRRLP